MRQHLQFQQTCNKCSAIYLKGVLEKHPHLHWKELFCNIVIKVLCYAVTLLIVSHETFFLLKLILPRYFEALALQQCYMFSRTICVIVPHKSKPGFSIYISKYQFLEHTEQQVAYGRIRTFNSKFSAIYRKKSWSCNIAHKIMQIIC